MKKNSILHKNMSISEFVNGYWYVAELKKFAKELGVQNTSKLRKDELEPIIKRYLKTGNLKQPNRKNLVTNTPKDSDIGLTLNLIVNHFTNNTETWDFLEKEAKTISPRFKRKSGTKYRLNRWRDEQITKGNSITYGDLAKKYVEINDSKEPMKRIAGTYYMYFLEDYMKNTPNATREEGIKAWHELKEMNIPKTYQEWEKLKRNTNNN